MQDRLEALAFKIKTRSIQLVRLLVYGLLCGTLVGAVASVFALGIDAATQLRGSHPWVIFLMPVGAALIIFFYQKFDHSEGTDTVLLAVTRSENVPGSMAPLIFCSTIISHFLGASVGREGAALQIGGCLGDELGKHLHFQESARRIIALVVLMAIVFLGIFFALSLYLSRRLTAPLRKLGEKMYQTAGGDMSVRFEPRFNDEIGLIGHQFDSMVDRLRESMEQLRESEHEKRGAELRALEMQINPHFMYNTLSTIVWLASEEKNEEVIDITKMLSRYLRQSLSDGREFIPVKDEIEHVRTYIRIQSTRYGDILKCHFDIQPETEAILMPKLMLQPRRQGAPGQQWRHTRLRAAGGPRAVPGGLGQRKHRPAAVRPAERRAAQRQGHRHRHLHHRQPVEAVLPGRGHAALQKAGLLDGRGHPHS